MHLLLTYTDAWTFDDLFRIDSYCRLHEINILQNWVCNYCMCRQTRDTCMSDVPTFFAVDNKHNRYYYYGLKNLLVYIVYFIS